VCNVKLGDLRVASFPKTLCEFLIVRRVLVVRFQDQYRPIFQKRYAAHVVPLCRIAIDLLYQIAAEWYQPAVKRCRSIAPRIAGRSRAAAPRMARDFLA
jgi:hypothetical protein